MLRVVFSSHASRQFEKIKEPHVRERIARALEALAESPLEGKPLQGPFSGSRSKRIGDYRVIYRVLPKEHVLGIARIDHRREVYR